jgi:hypothetical protein
MSCSMVCMTKLDLNELPFEPQSPSQTVQTRFQISSQRQCPNHHHRLAASACDHNEEDLEQYEEKKSSFQLVQRTL